MSAKTTTKVEQVGLAKILRYNRIQVPQNQREYSWREKEVTTLFQDLAGAINEDHEEYFLGTVVSVSIGSGTLEIVDGQQRLATTAILLAAIRDYLKTLEAQMADSIDRDFLTSPTASRRDTEPKLKLNVVDNEFFRNMIAGQKPAPQRSSHERIEKSFQLARAQVAKLVAPLDKRQHGDLLNRWVNFLEEGAEVILLTLPTSANAYRMFETLNDRGLKVTQADLVKNYFFGRAAERLPEAAEKWASMRGSLDSLDEDEVPTITYLRHALMLLNGYFREGDLFDEVQRTAKTASKIISLLDTLDALAGDYVSTFNPEAEKWNGYPDAIREAIKPLNLMNIKPLRPLMLAVASRFSEKEAALAYKKFISWDVRFLIAGSTSTGGTIERPIANAAKKVFNREITDTAALAAELAPVVPTDEAFQQAFAVATVSKAVLARYYLRSLEMVVKEEPDPWFIPNSDRETITLEHVLPFRPGANWPQFPDEAISATDVRRLGNMVLLQARQNSDLRSAGFDEKRNAYAEAPYETTLQVAASPSWDHDRIVARQKTLADLALKAWPL